MNAWYAAKMGNDHQGLVIDETSGRNVAASYDKADAHLIAAAPELLTWLEAALDHIMQYRQYSDEMAIQHGLGFAPASPFTPPYLQGGIQAIIAKAKGDE